ncbi:MULTISPECIES: porin [Emticicia]|uniref:porin n=1 Tax=Emticicia TaxID=312278 RepID=UPI001E454CF2|nr:MULTISPECIES: porin [Emticicia]
MKNLLKKIYPFTTILLMCFLNKANAQQKGALMDVDTSTVKKLLSTLKKYEYVGISGYIQPQYQFIQTEGAKSFNGGDYTANTDNRFMLRRGRLRFDYARFDKNNLPQLNFVFQFDGTERGVVIRDFWGRFYENKLNMFSLTTGMFARPFGFEVNYGSADRESLERGRMSQILMKVERDMGAMISLEPRTKQSFVKYIKFDIGAFNGQGLTATTDFDNHKDIITRFSIKPYKISPKLIVSGSISGLFGGMEQFTKYIYKMSGNQSFVVDSLASNIGKIAPRKYYGADVQIKIPNRVGQTEFRAEYIRGTQTATQSSSETPGIIPTLNGKNAPLYIRNFDGAYFYFLQHLGSKKHQFVAKYDWYDPNKKLKGSEIGKAFTAADIRFNTLGLGYVVYPNDNLRVTFWYEMPKNEKTNLTDYTTDVKDNNFTCRVQYRF